MLGRFVNAKTFTMVNDAKSYILVNRVFIKYKIFPYLNFYLMNQFLSSSNNIYSSRNDCFNWFDFIQVL